MPRPKFLMCSPEYFGVEYVINPWMEGQIGHVDRSTSAAQWNALYRVMTEQCCAEVRLISPQNGLPDMVFTANAGVVRRNRFIPSRFMFRERQGEEPFFETWFETQAFDVCAVEGHHEGAGDMLFGQNAKGDSVLFAAFGYRTDQLAHAPIAKALGARAVSLELVDPRFYHLDTCFCPLPGGYFLWFPPAFSDASRALVESEVAEVRRFAVSEDDATAFVCNAIAIPEHVVLCECSAETEQWLTDKGFNVHRTPLGEFHKAGGSAKCLSLRIDVP